MVAPRALILACASLAALVVVFSACSSDDEQSRSSSTTGDAGAVSEASSDVSASRSILPYPPGPYGAAVGDTMADFRVQGYALSREQRDSTKLPFRDVTLAEARSEPGCTCLLILWNAAGNNCQPCVEAQSIVAAEVARDPTFCAFEILFTSFDTFSGKDPFIQPPTRADLDAFSQSGRPNFPVGLFTESAVTSLGAGAINGFPSEYVVRTSDMRIAALIYGRHADLGGEAKALCRAPPPGPDWLLTGIAPRALAVDDGHAYIADGSQKILRVPRAGGPREAIAVAAGDPSLIALDDASVQWATRVAAGSFAVERAPKAPGSIAAVVASSASAYTSIASDGVRVYFTREDGVVGSALASGGGDEVLANGEDAPTSILVDASDVYWLARGAGEIVKMTKTGGARVTLVDKSAKGRSRILEVDDKLLVVESGNMGNSFQLVPKAGGPLEPMNSDYGTLSMASVDPASGIVDYVQEALPGLRLGKGDQAIVHFSLEADAQGNHWGDNYTAGQRDVVALASRGGYAYWITNGVSGGALKRMKR